MLDKLLGPELREAVQSHDWKALSELCTYVHPSVIAQILVDLDDFELGWSAFEHVDAQVRAQILEYLPEDLQDRLAARLPKGELAKLLEVMAHDDRVDLVKRMDDERQAETMPLVARADREDILRLAKYPEGTAGSIMTTDYAALPAEVTVQEALSRLRREAPNRETIYYVYVIDAHRRLLGFVSLKDLILAQPSRRVSEVMREDVIYVAATTDVETVAGDLARYDLLAMPVVDPEQRLVGIITHDDIIDVVIEEATEDAHRMGAVDPFTENYLEASFLTVWRKRTVWLSLLFLAELGTFSALAYFEQTIASVVVLSLFVPLCISTGGNSGSQAATIITREIALGNVSGREWRRVLWHELRMGLALGVTLGAIGFFRAALTPSSVLGSANRWALALVIGQAVSIICLWGTLVGSMLPLLFKWLRVDPGYASSPFVATFVDVTGILLFFSIAQLYLF